MRDRVSGINGPSRVLAHASQVGSPSLERLVPRNIFAGFVEPKDLKVKSWQRGSIAVRSRRKTTMVGVSNNTGRNSPAPWHVVQPNLQAPPAATTELSQSFRPTICPLLNAPDQWPMQIRQGKVIGLKVIEQKLNKFFHFIHSGSLQRKCGFIPCSDQQQK